jgi:hypothetical protein
MIEEGNATHFDPEVAAAFRSLDDSFRRVQLEMKEA